MIEEYPVTSRVQIEKLRPKYINRNVIVTGGASFIGSHLVDALLDLGARVTVVDDFSSGSRCNLQIGHASLNVVEIDLSDSLPINLFQDVDCVFHLAAIHGGRGFIETNPSRMLKNLIIDNNVFMAAKDSGVQSVVFASSACAYPVGLQESSSERNFLSESRAGKMDEDAMPDGLYGWTKLIGEYQLEKIFLGTTSVCRAARVFTAYGERENESHAAIALIAKSLLKLDPFPVWGDGNQTRNFTYVTDTVAGLISLGSEENPGFQICNVGTNQHITVNEFISVVFELCGWSPQEIDYQTSKPVGVASRSSDNSKIEEMFNWSPKVSISEGVSKTVTWYAQLPTRPKTLMDLDQKLMNR